MTAIETKINSFYQEAQESVNEIIEGSDEHLDLILSITKPLDNINKKFAELNESLFNGMNGYSIEDFNNILPKLKGINKLCMTLIGAIARSGLYRDVRIALKEFYKQHDLLREIIHDIHLILSKDDSIDQIMLEINEL
jgi:hypothetical protein